MSETIFDKYMKEKEANFESICKRCGICCGANDGDPCRNLKQSSDGLYYCSDYENRLGPQRTVNGNAFTCVTIRELIKTNTLRHGCAYNKY